MFRVNNKDTKTTSMTPFSSFSIVDFEQVNIYWKEYIVAKYINIRNNIPIFLSILCKLVVCQAFIEQPVICEI